MARAMKNWLHRAKSLLWLLYSSSMHRLEMHDEDGTVTVLILSRDRAIFDRTFVITPTYPVVETEERVH